MVSRNSARSRELKPAISGMTHWRGSGTDAAQLCVALTGLRRTFPPSAGSMALWPSLRLDTKDKAEPARSGVLFVAASTAETRTSSSGPAKLLFIHCIPARFSSSPPDFHPSLNESAWRVGLSQILTMLGNVGRTGTAAASLKAWLFLGNRTNT